MKKLTIFGKAALYVGGITMLLLFVMNTEVHLHPFVFHVRNAEKLMEVFLQVCVCLFFNLNGRMEGFKEGSKFVLDEIDSIIEEKYADKTQEGGLADEQE